MLERLGDRYDHPTWAGPRVSPVDELVLTILSQNTADTNSFRAFTALRAANRANDALDVSLALVPTPHAPAPMGDHPLRV